MRKRIIVVIALVIMGLVVIYNLFFHHQDTYEVGIARNQLTGEVTLIDTAGFNRNYPWVWVSVIDTRPTRVCLTTTARAFNCKLVQFDPVYYRDFVAVEGWSFYWWSNRLSFNYGYSDEYRGIRDILRGHAYGTKHYPFLKVLEEYSEQIE